MVTMNRKSELYLAWFVIIWKEHLLGIISSLREMANGKAKPCLNTILVCRSYNDQN